MRCDCVGLAARRARFFHYLLACGKITSLAPDGSAGINQRNSSVAAIAPPICARINPGASAGRIPEKVLLSARAIVTAGFANDVDAVNQYAAVMYAPTAKAVAFERSREHPQITASNPNVATNSLNI